MNRRKALLMSLLTGGLLPARLYGQDRGRRAGDDEGAVPGGFRRPRSTARLARRDDDELLADDEAPAPPPPDADDRIGGLPADIPTEPNGIFRAFDISKYTGLPHEASAPQEALIEWIFRRTGSATWHGDRIALGRQPVAASGVSHGQGAAPG
jgi:hypothetical protein